VTSVCVAHPTKRILLHRALCCDPLYDLYLFWVRDRSIIDQANKIDTPTKSVDNKILLGRDLTFVQHLVSI
jgi:hypothetical protein